jgi:hypothetical protein
VDGCQEQGILEESSSGSRGSYCAVALIMMMMMSTSKHLSIPASKSCCEQWQGTKERCLFSARSVLQALHTLMLTCVLISGMCRYGRDNSMVCRTALGHVTRYNALCIDNEFI